MIVFLVVSRNSSGTGVCPSFNWVVLDLPHLLVHADQLHCVFAGHSLIVCRKDEIRGFLFE